MKLHHTLRSAATSATLAQGVLAGLLAVGASFLASRYLVPSPILIGMGFIMLVASGVTLVLRLDREDPSPAPKSLGGQPQFGMSSAPQDDLGVHSHTVE